MNNKKILIFGSTGMLGRYIYNFFNSLDYQVQSLNRSEYDASDISLRNLLSIEKIKNLNKGDVIINCIGLLPHVYKDNSISKKSYEDSIYSKFILANSILPHNLEKIKIIKSIKVINITSDCVFSGFKGNYSEIDKPDYMWPYGVTKTAGECSLICNIRSSIIGEETYNKRALLEWVISNKNGNINGYTNYLWNGITCLEMAKLINKLINENLIWEGTRHVFSPEILSKYELVCLINKIYDLNISIKKFELPDRVDRSLSSIYDINFGIPNLSQQIKELSDFNNE